MATVFTFSGFRVMTSTYPELLLKIDLEFLLRKIGARFNLKVRLISLHVRTEYRTKKPIQIVIQTLLI